MEITKGENANLAGMEPRCPKCGSKNVALYSSSVKKCYIECKNPECEFDLAPETVADFAQFFRSPAPTPPLDVQTEFDESESPTTPRDLAVEIVDKCCGCTMESASSQSHHRYLYDRVESYLQGFINHSLRRHIAIPAPRSCPKCGSPVCQPYKSTDDDLWTQRCNKCEWFEKWSGLASPAQPEKRDEWVSVENGPPRDGLEVSILISDESVAIEGWPTNGYQINGEWWCGVPGHYVSCSRENWTVTHWQPLPAPPQSGKEGQ